MVSVLLLHTVTTISATAAAAAATFGFSLTGLLLQMTLVFTGMFLQAMCTT